MANTTITLRDGLTIGEVKHTDAEIRELTAGDLLDATTESEKVVQVPGEGPQLLTSPTLLGLNTLRRQIVRIGDHKGPMSIIELKRLSVFDLNLIQANAELLENASFEVAQRGRD